MTVESRENPIFYVFIGVFVVGVAYLAAHSGGPKAPSMPGVKSFTAPLIAPTSALPPAPVAAPAPTEAPAPTAATAEDFK